MGNCLVTKLKGTVDNNNLLKLGEIRLYFKSDEGKSSKPMTLAFKSEATITVIEGTGSFVVDGTTYGLNTPYTIPANVSKSFNFSLGTFTVSIVGKYDILNITQSINNQATQGFNMEMNISDFKYSEDMTDLICGFDKELVGSLEDLPRSLQTLYIGNSTKITGDWGVLNEMPNLQAVSIPSTIGGNLLDFPNVLTSLYASGNNNILGSINDLSEKTQITIISLARVNSISGGQIQSLGKLTSLTSLTLAEMNDYSKFNGSTIEAFVAAQISNGRTTVPTSSPISCPWLLHVATFGGQHYNVTGYMYLTWDSANKITIYQGGPGGLTNCPNIYAKGATAQEIADWEQAGKTVIQIS